MEEKAKLKQRGIWETHIGHVVQPNSRDSVYIDAYCPDFFPIIEGNINSESEKVKIALQPINPDDDIEQIEVYLNYTIQCEYIDFTGGMVSVPDMAQGETIIIIKKPGDERYFWSPLRSFNYYRKSEHIKLICMDKQHIDAPSSDEVYSVEIDTSDEGDFRGVSVDTGKGRGESRNYQCKINTKDNTVTISDDLGNIIQLASNTNTIRMINHYGTRMVVSQKDALIYAPRDVSIKSDGNISASSGGNTTLHANGALSLVSLKGSTLQSDGAMNFNTAKGFSISAPQIALDGNVKISGSLLVGGSASFPGGHGPH